MANTVNITLIMDDNGTVKATTGEVKGGLDQMDKASTRTANRMRQQFKGMTQQLGSLFPLASAAGAGLVFKKMTDHAQDFESALADMGKVTDETLESIRKKILSLDSSLGGSTDLVRGYYQVISAGVTEPAEAMDVLTTAAKAAQASHTSQAEVIKGLTKTMAGFEGQIRDAAEASDLLFAIEKEGQTSFQELVPVVGSLAKLSRDLGVASSEMGGSLALITQTAGSTEEAATRYRALLVAMLKPTEAMTEALNEMGYQNSEAAIEALGLAGVLEKLQDYTGGASDKMAELFGRQEALLGFSSLAAEDFGIMAEKIEAVKNGLRGTEKAFNAFGDTAAAESKRARAEFEKLSIAAGGSFLAIKSAALRVGIGLFSFLDDAGKGIGTLAAALAGFDVSPEAPEKMTAYALAIERAAANIDRLEREGASALAIQTEVDAMNLFIGKLKELLPVMREKREEAEKTGEAVKGLTEEEQREIEAAKLLAEKKERMAELNAALSDGIETLNDKYLQLTTTEEAYIQIKAAEMVLQGAGYDLVLQWIEAQKQLLELKREEAALDDQKRAQRELEALPPGVDSGSDLASFAQAPFISLPEDEFTRQLTRLNEQYIQRITLLKELGATEEQINMAKNQRLAEQDKIMWKVKVEGAKAATQGLMDFTQALFLFSQGKSREMFELNKVAAIANATVNTYQAFTNALATKAPWPLPQIFAAAALASGLAQVANIQATSFGGGGGAGGSAGSTGFGSGTTSNPPTPVVPAQQQEKQRPTIIFQVDKIELVDEDSVDRLMERISERVEDYDVVLKASTAKALKS